MELLINPGVPIPAQATEIHGITDERVRSEGMHYGVGILLVLETLELALSFGIPLVGMNLRYDLTVLDREARRCGLIPLQDRLRLRVVDVLVLDKWLDRYRPGSRKLDALCAHYGASLDGAHAAEHDAVAAARVAWCIAHHGNVIRKAWKEEMYEENRWLRRDWYRARDDLDALHELQRRVAHHQAASLADHFHDQRQFEDAMSVSFGWPVG